MEHQTIIVRNMSDEDLNASIEYAQYIQATDGLSKQDYKENTEELVILESEQLRRLGDVK